MGTDLFCGLKLTESVINNQVFHFLFNWIRCSKSQRDQAITVLGCYRAWYLSLRNSFQQWTSMCNLGHVLLFQYKYRHTLFYCALFYWASWMLNFLQIEGKTFHQKWLCFTLLPLLYLLNCSGLEPNHQYLWGMPIHLVLLTGLCVCVVESQTSQGSNLSFATQQLCEPQFLHL